MVSENSPDNLPPGWKEYVKVKNGKKTKYYSKAATGQKFYSKLAVMRYVNTPVDTPTPQSKTEFDQTPQMPIDHENEASASQADTVSQAVTMNQADTDGPDTNGSTLMLPPGWITEVKTREGSTSKFKIYIDPATGKKFYSQPQVSRYLKALSNKEAPVEKNQDGADRPDTKKSPVVLPPGWTTEVETRTNGSTFKIYMDPSTGKKFYSLPQVSRYLNAQSHKEVPVEKNQDEADRPDTNEVNMPVDVVDTPTPQSKTEFNQTPQTPIDHGKEVSVSQADTDGPDTNGSTSWLPPGWITEVKSRMGSTGSTSTFKVYIDPATGKKFYSQPQVSRYLKALSHEESPVETIKDGVDRPDTNKSPVVLPPGWTTKVELRNNGSNFKVYVDPATGKRFYSLPQVSRYLKALSHEEVQVENNQDGADISPIGVSPGWTTEVEPQSNGSTYENVGGGKSASETDVYENQVLVKKQGSRTREGKGSSSKQTWDVTESGPADGLPVGWIKEIRSRHRANGIKKDPYYTDPVSGYVFRSKKDALRYLETGDIRSCSMKPMKAVGPLPIAVSYEDVDPVSVHIQKEDHRSISDGEAKEVFNFSEEPLKSDQLQNTQVDGLPIGWIREIQTRKGGHGKDTFYVDPVSGYMFRSKPDALRYIETGDISKCKLKPKKRGADDIGSAQQASGDDASGQHTSRRTRRSISNKEENKISDNSGELVKTAPEELALHTPAAGELPIGWTIETQIRKDGIMKDYFYTDPDGKYTFRSKRDALRYVETGDISKCASRPKIRGINGTGSKKQNDASQHLILDKDQKSNENTISNYSGEPVQNSAVEGLPTGWTREIQIRSSGIGRDSFYIDPVSGYMFRSKMDALRYIETGDISKCAIKPKKRDVNDAGSTKQVTTDDVSQHSASKRKEKAIRNYSEEPVQNSAVEGLPVGWTREIQMRRDGIGKDSFYIDPVSGYMFRSKTDALRYIETGDISKCAMKPKKRDANAAVSAEHVADPLTPVSRKKSVSSKRRRDSSLPSGNDSPADSSSKRSSGRTSKRLAGYQPEMPNLQVTERDLRAAMKMTCEDEASILPMITNVSSIALPPPVYSETTEIPKMQVTESDLPVDGNPVSLPLPVYSETTSVDVNPSHEPMKMSYADEASISPMITTNASPIAMPLVDSNPSHEQTLPKRVPKLKVSRNTPANSRKSNKGITTSTPVRASQQPWIDINDVPQPFQSGVSTNKAVGMSAGNDSRPLDTEVSDVVGNVVQKNVETSVQQINEKQDVENSKPQDVQGGYQFVDPLPNPFMNFTYSNPTSVTPDEGNLAYQGFSQQQTNNSFFQGNEYSAWSGSQSLGYSQDGNSVRQQPHVQQFSSQNLGYSQDGNAQQPHLQQFSSTFTTPGFGYPSSFGSSNTQQPTSDNRNTTAGFGYPPPPFGSSGSQQPPSDNRNDVYKRHQ